MQHDKAHRSAFGLGGAQAPAEPSVEDDVAAIRELLDHIRCLEDNRTAHTREALAGQLEVLQAAVQRRDTGLRPVRESLQQVLLDLGTGALAPMGEPTRRRLAVLTGIALPDGRERGGGFPHPANLRSWASYQLHKTERSTLARLAGKVRTDPYRDLPTFARKASAGWNQLSPRLREAVGALADGSSSRPELYLTNLPRIRALELTPSRYRAGRTTAGILSEYLMMVFAMMVFAVGLGHPISYPDQRDGNIFHDVFPTPHNAEKLSSQSSTVTLGFHTEMFFHPVAPGFLILHCLRADPNHHAVTCVAALADIEADLDPAARASLRRP